MAVYTHELNVPSGSKPHNEFSSSQALIDSDMDMSIEDDFPHYERSDTTQGNVFHLRDMSNGARLPVASMKSDGLHLKALGRSSTSLKDWWWELTGALLSFVCTAFIIGVLFAAHGRALSSWPLRISPNAFISVLSTLSKAALMVPVASCIGQLKWTHFKKSPRPLHDVETFDGASRGPWGALNLLWHFETCTALAALGSMITIAALAMDPFTQEILSFPSRTVKDLGGAAVGATQVYDTGNSRNPNPSWYQQMSPSMQGAIVNGFYALDSPAKFTCQTADCTWPEFTTLGVSSKCTNVTSETKVACTPFSADAHHICNYTTPGGFQMAAVSWESSGGGFETQFNSSARVQVEETLSDVVNDTIVSFATANITYSLELPDIMECELTWCAKSFQNVNVMNGTFSAGTSKDYTLDGVPYFDDSTKQFNTYSVSPDQTDYPGNRTFNINPTDHRMTAEYLQTIFSSDSTESWGQSLMRSTSIAGTAQNISISMTSAVQNGPNSLSFPGYARSVESYIHVHWPWLALPVTIVTLSLVFLVCSIVHTKRNGIQTWKSSNIPLLLARSYGWTDEELNARSWEQMERRSETMQGMLRADDAGVLYFVRT